MNGAAEAILEELLAQSITQTQLLQRLARGFTGGSGSAAGGGGGGGGGIAAGLISSFNPLSLAMKAVTGAFSLLSSIIGGVVNIFKSLVNAAVDVTKRLFEFGKQAMTAGVKVSDFLNVFAGLPIIGRLFSIASNLQQINELILDGYRNISTVGATFGGSQFNFQAAAARSGLTLNEFSRVVRSNADDLAAFGGTTEKGAVALARMNMAFMTGADRSGRSILGLGLQFDEAANYLSSYMGMLGKSGDDRNMSDATVVQKAREYVFELDALTRLTGISREEADKKAQEIRNDRSFQAFLSTKTTAEKEFINSYLQMANAMDPEWAKQLKMQFMGLSIPVGDFGKNLIVTGQSAMLSADRYVQAAKSNMTAQQRMEFFAQDALRMGKGFSDFAARMPQLVALGGINLNSRLTELGTRLRNREITTDEFIKGLMEEQTTAAQGSAAAAAEAELGMRQLGQGIMGAFMPILKALMPPLLDFANWLSGLIKSYLPEITKKLEEFINWFTKKIGEYVGIFRTEGFSGLFKKMFTDVSAGLAEFWKTIKPPIMDFFNNYLVPWFDRLMIRVEFYLKNLLNRLSGGLAPGDEESYKEERDKQLEISRINAERIQSLREAQRLLLETQTIASDTHPSGKQWATSAAQTAYARMAELINAIQENRSQMDIVLPARHSGTIGMTGSWWEKESGPLNVQAGETVLTKDQLAQIVDTASQSGLANQVERLNNLTAQMLVYLKATAENTAKTHKAAAAMQGNLLVG
jgi:hypothetical protein